MKLYKLLVYTAALLTLTLLFFITAMILLKGIPAINAPFIKSLAPSLVSTIIIIVIALIFALPAGVMCAIYLSEYAHKNKFTLLINYSVDCLAGIPSVIYGLFGMTLFVVTLRFRWSLLSGGLTVGIMILPGIIRIAQQSVSSIPQELREGSYALGVSKIITILKIVLPCARKGIATAVCLSIGRIMGETAAVYLTAGMAIQMPYSVMDSGRTLSVHLYMLAKESPSLDAAFATASVLILLIALLQFLGRV